MSYLKIGSTIFASLALVTFAWPSEPDEMRDKARAMQRFAADLAELGEVEAAENLERQALAMLEETEQLERHRPDRRKAEIRDLQERVEMLRLEERELREVGGKEWRLDAVRREAERLERELNERSHDGHDGERGPQDEIARRLEYMRVAMEHLHHAGLDEIAEHVEERAEAVEQELQEHHNHRQADPINHIMKQLDEIRHEVERLRDEVNEIKEKR